MVSSQLGYDPWGLIWWSQDLGGGSAPPPPTLACPVGGGTGTLGVLYNKTLVTTGSGPFLYEITDGAIPPGTALNDSNGNIVGILTALGTYGYTVQVTDSIGVTAEATCEVVVSGSAPEPPDVCEIPAVTEDVTAQILDEPLELQGS